MKRILSLILALVTGASLSVCGCTENKTAEETGTGSAEEDGGQIQIYP